VHELKNRLTMKEAASYLGHSYSWLFTNHRSLGLKGYQIGSRWYFDPQYLKDWEANLKSDYAASSRAPKSTHLNSDRIKFT